MQKFLKYVAPIALALSFAAPAFAYPATTSGINLNCTPASGTETTCTVDWPLQPSFFNGTTVELYTSDTDTFDDATATGIICSLPNCTFASFDPTTNGTKFLGFFHALSGEHSSSATFNATTGGGGAFTLASVFSQEAVIGTVTDVLGDAGPYVLALFGLLVTVGVGMALLGRARKGIVNAVKGGGSERSNRKNI